MKTARAALLLIASLATFLLTGCGADNPMAPEAEPAPPPPPPPARTPVGYVINKILVVGFNRNAPDGGDWDWAVFVEDRKPDIWVSLKGRPALPIYNSDIRLNANHNTSYTFTRPASDLDGHLPRELAYGDDADVAVVDDDPFGDTVMATVKFKGSAMYRGDDATALDHTFTGSNGVRVRLQGVWVY